MPPESPHSTTPPVALLLAASWVISLSIVAGLIYLIARQIIKKADADDLPQILTALVPVITALAHLLTRSPGAAQLNAGDSAGLPPAVATTDDEPTDKAGEWQA